MNVPENNRVFVAGHRGMVGSAIVRYLAKCGYDQDRVITRCRQQLDLTDQRAVSEFFAAQKIDHVYLAAAKVGGIYANSTYPADFIYQNIVIQSNIIHAAYQHGVQRLMFLGSSCIYPKMAAQPMPEEALMTGPLEPTNEPYALAKIAGIKLCESYNRQYGTDFRSVMPTNLYGPGDNYHPENSHVVPALIRKFHEAKISGAATVTIWGSGRPLREFLHVDEMAEASVHLLNIDRALWNTQTEPMRNHINVGSGEDLSIADLAELIRRTVGHDCTLEFDSTKPDGTPRKLMDNSRAKSLGWEPRIDLPSGLRHAYEDFLMTWSASSEERLPQVARN
jgi:GDP-L-fucose synthase